MAGLHGAHRARLHVTLAGHGDADAVRRAITANGLDGTVEVRTWIGPEERDALLGTAQILLLPSWWEGLPDVRARGHGVGPLPGGHPRGWARHARARRGQRRRRPVGDPPALTAALDKLLSDDEVRVRIGARARESVRAFAADAWADRLVTLYRELLGS